MEESSFVASQLAFDAVGTGETVLLVHGHPFDRTLWRPQIDPLVDAGFRVVTPDLRGYGETPATRGIVTMRQLADDIVALLDRLAVRRFTAVGLSMGGLVAMELAIGYRSRIWALGLVATTAEPVDDGERARRRAVADAAERDGMGPVIEAMDGLYVPGCPRSVIAEVDRMMTANDPVGSAAALRGRAERPDYRPGLSELDVPALVCVGTRDPWSTEAVTDNLIATLRLPEVVRLPGIGHLPNLEATDEFNSALIAFLTRAAPA